MFASGEQKRLVIPKTSTETLRELLGELFPQDREQQLLREGRVEFTYEAAQLGPFRVTLTKRGGGGVLALDAGLHDLDVAALGRYRRLQGHEVAEEARLSDTATSTWMSLVGISGVESRRWEEHVDLGPRALIVGRRGDLDRTTVQDC